MTAIQQIKASGGVLYRITDKNECELLLIHRNGIWDLPKGKMEPGETSELCAVREVQEETGIPSIISEDFLTETYHEYQDGDDKIVKTTHWYMMRTDDPFFQPVPQIEEGITKVEWIEMNSAKKMVGYKNLSDVLGQFEKRFSSSTE